MIIERLQRELALPGGDGGLLPPISDGLVGWWPMNEGSGNVKEGSGKGWDAPLTDGATWDSIEGETCVNFNDTGRVALPRGIPELENFEALTLCCWVNVYSFIGGYYSTWIAHDPPSGTSWPDRFLYAYTYSQYFQGRRGGNSLGVNPGPSLSGKLNQWVHLAGRFGPNNSTNWAYLRDGGSPETSDDSYTDLNQNPTWGWTFGRTLSTFSTTRAFCGMRDVRIYNRDLSDVEIAQIAQGDG